MAGDSDSGPTRQSAGAATPSPEPMTADAQTRRRTPATPQRDAVDVARAPLDDRGLAERYELRSVLGEGGMGEVRLCRDRRIGRDVAMKVIRRGQGSRSDARARFEREARVQGQLEHPSVVPVYDLGITPEGAAFFTMKRVQGLTLDEILAGLASGDASVAAAHSTHKLLSAFASVCLAVAFAHDRGVFHRDLKPTNIMLGSFGEVHVLDWGVAKVRGVPDVVLEQASPEEDGGDVNTLPGDVLGTPGYMAPEQVLGNVDAIDARTDVYALGAILFEILTLAPLHRRDQPQQVLAATLAGADARASVRAPARAVPPELEAICVRATARHPQDRFASAHELHAAVERYLEGDRDLERRRQIAASHAAAARRAEAGAAAGEGDPDEGRRLAMREAAAALALDADNRDAVDVIVRVLLVAPNDAGEAARRELAASARVVERSAARSTFLLHLGWMAFVPIVLAIGVKSWPVALGGLAATALALAGSYLALVGDWGRWGKFAAYLLGLSVVAFVTQIAGPLVLAPHLAVTSVLAYCFWGDRRLRPAATVLSVVAVLAPWALSAAGVLPPSYLPNESGVLIVPHMIALTAPTFEALMILSIIALIVPAAVLVGRLTDNVNDAEERLLLHAYHLRQLLPERVRVLASDAPLSP